MKQAWVGGLVMRSIIHAPQQEVQTPVTMVRVISVYVAAGPDELSLEVGEVLKLVPLSTFPPLASKMGACPTFVLTIYQISENVSDKPDYWEGQKTDESAATGNFPASAVEYV